jgi:hypothetical protein
VLTGRIEATLRNDAPAQGLPSGVIGPYDGRFAAGENRTYLSIYSPFDLQAADVDGRPVGLDTHAELDRQAHSAQLSLAALQSRTVGLDVAGRVRLSAGGWYRLDVLHQPSLTPETTDIEVTVPPGWRIAEAPGLRRAGPRRALGHFLLERPGIVMVRVERTTGPRRAAG